MSEQGANQSPRQPLAGRTILLRALAPSDYDELIEISVYDGRFASTADEAREINERILQDCGRGESVHWVISQREDLRIVGTIGFYRGFTGKVGELGYIIKADHRHNGYASEAVALACEFGFSELGLREIVAYTESDNIGSIKVLQRNAFHRARADESASPSAPDSALFRFSRSPTLDAAAQPNS